MIRNIIKYSFSSGNNIKLLTKQLSKLGLNPRNVLRNPSVSTIYKLALNSTPAHPQTPKTRVTDTGALAAYSFYGTGRVPSAKRIVDEETTRDNIWWGKINIKLSEDSFELMKENAKDYITNRPNVFVIDGYGGWHQDKRYKVRIICTRPYHALFMRNMLIRPTDEQLKDFDEGVNFTVYNAGDFNTSDKIDGVDQKTCVSINFKTGESVILGTQYAGEMKKGFFTVAHYVYPTVHNWLTMHASANEGKDGDVSVIFGLSGTGKTTLSADPNRQLIGDDEHCWSDTGVFNIEGGCYAKTVDLTEEQEPDIYRAIKYGALLENVGFKKGTTDEVDYTDVSITENTRCSYPLEYIPNAKIPATGGHAKNIIFLTADAFGVLPPVSKLNLNQAMYHFITGYTAKVAGTEVGVLEPQATFSACFGDAFLPLHPARYANMLEAKMIEHKADAWLINTGWTGGRYGEGSRIALKYSRAILDAIHSGELNNVEYEKMDTFGIKIPKSCPGVPKKILNPRKTWKNKQDYDDQLQELGEMMVKNFEQYTDEAGDNIIKGGPKL